MYTRYFFFFLLSLVAPICIEHLNAGTQHVCGPIQDDEALLLFSVVKVMRLRRILEVGGLDGYSARNFLEAMKGDRSSLVYTVDISPVTSLSSNHITIQKSVVDLTAADVGNIPLDLIFFDAHVYTEQMIMFENLQRENIITDSTIIALHDTGLHFTINNDYGPRCPVLPLFFNGEGYIHQMVERQMVNELKRRGYDALVLHTQDADRHDDSLRYRHGITIMQKFKPLRNRAIQRVDSKSSSA